MKTIPSLLASALLGLGLLAQAAQATDYLPETTPLRIPVPQAAAMDRAFPRSADCDALRGDYIAAGWPMGAGIETLRGIDARLKRQLVMRNDRGPDTWTPLAAQIIAGKRPAGDCDDISITSAQLAICAGMPPEDVGVLITTSPQSGALELHMMAFFRDHTDRVWVFGDSFGKPRALSKVRQDLLFFANMSDIRRWYALHGSDTTSPDGAGPTSSIPLSDAVTSARSCEAPLPLD